MIKKKTNLVLMSICIFVAFMLSSFAIITGNSIGTYAEHEGLVISQEKYNKNPLVYNAFESHLRLSSSSERSDNEATISGNGSSYTHTAIGEFTDVKYISNANYFLINPWHHDNTTNTGLNAAGVCTTVSLQMLMGYHNYYSDRRIIPTTGNNRSFLDANYGNLAGHPALQRSITNGQGCQQIGTSDDFFHELYEAMLWPDFYGLGQAVGLVKDTGIEFMNNHTPQEVRNNISLTSGLFSKSTAQLDIDAGIPIVLGIQPIFTGADSFHVIPAYGYAKLDGVDGFLVHYGWGASRTQVWIPSSWCAFQIRMSVDHTHNFIDTRVDINNTHRQLECTTCGYSTVDNLYNISGSTITDIKYPLTKSIVIPKSIEIYSENTASFTTQPITTIGTGAFANQVDITSIVIPSSITSIESKAFENCKNINSLNSSSNVTYIGDNAFYNCKELTSVKLPNISYLGKNAFAECIKLKEVSFGENAALNTISERAFYNTGLTSFTIPVNVVNIEKEAFLGSTITSIVGNTNYVWQDNVLIKCNVSDTSKKVAVYVNPTVSSITFPNNVASISANLFKDNHNIKTVYLNQVQNIGPDAFRNSSLTNIHKADNIIDCDKTALLDTPWYENNQSDFIVLGEVLIEYRGTGSIINIPDNVSRIGADCFSNNATTQVVLPEQIDSIGQAAFKGLTALKSVIFTSDFPPLLDGDCFSENVILYVKESRLTEYKNNISFIILPNTITIKEIQINFYDIDNNFIGSSTEFYGSKFDNYLNAPTIKGKDFCGWDYNGFNLNINDMIKYYDNLELTAVYETAKYQIKIVGEDGEQILTLEYGQQVSLPIPHEDGKIFKGWFDQVEGGNVIVDTTGKCIWDRTFENDILYPQFDNIIYKIIYSGDYADIMFDMPNNFTVDNPITKTELLSPQKFGYVFKGWLYNNQEFTSTTGIFSDMHLIEAWEGKNIVANQILTITDNVAIVDMTSAYIFYSYNITIASSVNSVTFVGKINTSYSLTINISDRSKAIVLGLKNMQFQAPGGNSANAINCNSNIMIYVTYFGSIEIKGGAGANATGNGINGDNGGCGILAGSVTLMAFDSSSKISIYGGNGGNGSNGYGGYIGNNGIRGPSGSIFKPVKGENGTSGTDGYCGGNGGEGGYAIYASSLNIFVSNNSNYYIKGGNGGNGGNGGFGGKGGNGADDTSANPFNGVGVPGDGGNGGNGGANGGAGQGTFGTNCGQLTTVSGEIGADGKPGGGGAAGSGGFHGTVGKDGVNGADGKSGSDGELITTPMGDGLADGQTQADDALVDLPYAFSAEFLDMYLS